MKFLVWAMITVLGLALINWIACWFGLDVAANSEKEERSTAHGDGLPYETMRLSARLEGDCDGGSLKSPSTTGTPHTASPSRH